MMGITFSLCPRPGLHSPGLTLLGRNLIVKLPGPEVSFIYFLWRWKDTVLKCDILKCSISTLHLSLILLKNPSICILGAPTLPSRDPQESLCLTHHSLVSADFPWIWTSSTFNKVQFIITGPQKPYWARGKHRCFLFLFTKLLREQNKILHKPCNYLKCESPHWACHMERRTPNCFLSNFFFLILLFSVNWSTGKSH